MANYIYTRQYGLQPRITDFNYRFITVPRGTNYAELLKPNISTGKVEVITKKTFNLFNFLGTKQITVEKLGDAKFVEPMFDFNRFKIKVSGVQNYPYGSNSINIYDRTAIRKILGSFLTFKIDEIQDFFYTNIAGQESSTETVRRAVEILELVFEFGDEIHNFISLVKNLSNGSQVNYEITTTGQKKETETMTGKTPPETGTPPATSTTQSNKYFVALAFLGVLVIAKKKKWL